MVQIISDRPSNWLTWIGGVVERLEKYPDVTRIAVIADIEDEDCRQVIEFMNCSTDDVYYLGGLLQKEAIKHEMMSELGIDDDGWEEEDDDE